jgi:hypothetical protein
MERDLPEVELAVFRSDCPRRSATFDSSQEQRIDIERTSGLLADTAFEPALRADPASRDLRSRIMRTATRRRVHA